MHRTLPPGGITGLTRRIRSQRDIWMVEQYIARAGGVHLKDVSVGPMDDERRMRVGAHPVVNFGCDSYLGLDRDPRIQKAFADAVPSWGLHSGASRMFYSVELYAEAERQLAEWMGVDDTLIFPSVSLANLGVLPGIVHPGDALIVDKRSHDSLHHAAGVAASAGVNVHTEIARIDLLEPIVQSAGDAGLVLAVDGVYSMTGDSPPLAELDLLLRRSGGTLYVDDAHSTGVVGPGGRGVAAEVLPDLDEVIVVGSLSKAFSCMGAFVTCTPELKPLLKMRARTWIFGGPVPPPYLAAICAVCDLLGSPEFETLTSRLRARISQFREGLARLNRPALRGPGPIVSIPVGSIDKTLAAGRALFERGYYVQSVTYPAVSVFEGLLRVLINANHSPAAIDGLLNAFTGLPL